MDHDDMFEKLRKATGPQPEYGGSSGGKSEQSESGDFDHDQMLPKDAMLRLLKLKFAKLSAENNKKEHEAIEGYDETLHCLKKVVTGDGDSDADDNLPGEFLELCKKFRDDIIEIERDELNHAKKLEKWHLIFSGLEPMED